MPIGLSSIFHFQSDREYICQRPGYKLFFPLSPLVFSILKVKDRINHSSILKLLGGQRATECQHSKTPKGVSIRRNVRRLNPLKTHFEAYKVGSVCPEYWDQIKTELGGQDAPESTAFSRNLQKGLANLICTGLLHSNSNMVGLATKINTAFALEIATLNRLAL